MLETDIFSIANLCRFSHNAMAATFEVFIVHRDAVYAEQAARAAFEELDHIEVSLSRFVENSDVSRINSLTKGRPLQIGLTAFECLQISVDICRQTDGAFDVTLGQNHLKLDEINHTIELLNDGIQIDLGGIGKGFAADKMGQLLGEWSIDTALISAGQSTVLPIGIPQGLKGWPVTLSDPRDYSRVLVKVVLAGRALSASGLHKGPHIIDPQTGKPVKGKLAAWAAAKTGAEADALSTAFMVMSADRIQAFCKVNADIGAVLFSQGTNKELAMFGCAIDLSGGSGALPGQSGKSCR